MRFSVLVSAALVALSGTVALANPAVAAAAWEMPDVMDMNLEQATAAINSITDGQELAVESFNTTGAPQEQLNPTNWIVCWQKPKSGEPVSETTWVGVGVRRPNQSCW